MNQQIQSRSALILLMVILLSINYSNDLKAQASHFKLIDQESRFPIVNANYKYGNTNGVSSEEGEIIITFEPSITLYISHIQYGKLSFTPEEITNALNNKQLLLKPISHSLQPVTFIRIHHEPGEQEKMFFQVQDQLSHDAGKVLEQFSSISTIRKSAAYGFDPVLRGFKYDQINLVIDGTQCATAGCPNRMDPASSQVPMNMVTTAEVLKGPHSLRYGNAFGGTINFKSAAPSFSNKTSINGRVGTSYETNGSINRSEAVLGLHAKRIDISLFGSLSEGGDYKDGADMEVPADFYRSNVGAKLGLKLSDFQSINLLVSNNFAKDVDFPALPMDLRKDDTWLINLGHKAHFFKHALSSWETTLYTTKVDHLMDNRDKVLNPRMVDANTSAKTNNAGGRTEWRFDFASDHLYAGADLRYENADGKRERNMLMGPMAGKGMIDNVWQDATILKSGMYAEYHHQQESYNLILSGRMEFNHAKANDPDTNFASNYEDMSSTLINPAISVGGTKTLSKKISLGLWLGTAQRSGSLAEQYINFFPIGLDPYEMLGNPQLDAETNNQLDLVFNYKSNKTHININLFSSFLRNYISSEIREDLHARMATAPGVRQFINIDKAQISGFEMSWAQRVSRYLQQIAELAYTHGRNVSNDEALPEIPPLEFRYRLIGEFIEDRWRTEINFRHAFEQNRIAKSYGETSTPAFNVVDLKSSFALNKQFSISASALNILDEAYYEHLSRSIRDAESRPIYSPGRSFYFSMSYQF